MGETYIKVRGGRKYLYRAADKQSHTLDFFSSEHRDIESAKRFFTRAIERRGAVEKVTVDAYPATHGAIAELKKSGKLSPQVLVRTSKYLNNLTERDHRRVKQRIYLMLGFKKFGNAAVTIGGVELAHKIKKGEFNASVLGVGEGRAAEVWEAVLAA
jgi:transposase-like protein